MSWARCSVVGCKTRIRQGLVRPGGADGRRCSRCRRRQEQAEGVAKGPGAKRAPRLKAIVVTCCARCPWSKLEEGFIGASFCLGVRPQRQIPGEVNVYRAAPSWCPLRGGVEVRLRERSAGRRQGARPASPSVVGAHPDGERVPPKGRAR